jgi:hypothetical protein
MTVIAVFVDMAMRCSICVRVLVLVERYLEPAVERRRDPAKRRDVRQMIAAFQTRDHGFRHPDSVRELFLRLARCRT